jgi:hypothetical protein
LIGEITAYNRFEKNVCQQRLHSSYPTPIRSIIVNIAMRHQIAIFNEPYPEIGSERHCVIEKRG